MPLPAAGEKKSWVRAPYRENFARLFSLGPRVRAPYRELGNLNSSSLRSVRLVLPEREPEIGSVRLRSRSIVCCFLFPAACPALAPHASQELQRSSLASPSPCVFFGLIIRSHSLTRPMGLPVVFAASSPMCSGDAASCLARSSSTFPLAALWKATIRECTPLSQCCRFLRNESTTFAKK